MRRCDNMKRLSRADEQEQRRKKTSFWKSLRKEGICPVVSRDHFIWVRAYYKEVRCCHNRGEKYHIGISKTNKKKSSYIMFKSEHHLKVKLSSFCEKYHKRSPTVDQYPNVTSESRQETVGILQPGNAHLCYMLMKMLIKRARMLTCCGWDQLSQQFHAPRRKTFRLHQDLGSTDAAVCVASLRAPSAN